MVGICKQVMLTFIVLLAGGAWGLRSVQLSDILSDTVHKQKGIQNTHDHDQEEHKQKTDAATLFPATVKNKLIGSSERMHQAKDFDLRNMIESIFQPFQPLCRDEGKKPKVKTVVSLTEFIGPKHNQDVPPSSFGFKDFSLMDDPFAELNKFMSFIPKFSKIDVVVPLKHKDKNENSSNLEPFSLLPSGIWHHHQKREFDPTNLGCQDKAKDLSNIDIKDSSNGAPLMSIGNVKFGEDTIEDDEPLPRDKMSCLVRSLPYIEGAIGGVMFVMLILVIASWRIKKPNSVWAQVPFVDKTQYTEKV